MNRLELREMYSIPESYKPPEISQLSTNTQYPNLNSIEYRYKPQDDTLVELHRFFEFLTVNAFGTIALATNNYNGRIWSASIFAYASFDDVGKEGKELFKLRVQASITALHWYCEDMILFTTADGDIQLWSTQSPLRNPNGYSLFNIAKRTEHIGMVTTMEMLGAKNEMAITGSSTDNCIKIWSIDVCDLISEHTYRYAHTDTVMGLSVKPEDGHLFASCAYDGNLLIWDHRSLKPVVKHFSGGPSFTTVDWSNSSGVEQILLGDVNGELHTYDPRNIQVALKSINVCNRSIHKLKPNNGLVAVLSQSNKINVLNTQANYSVVYRNAEAVDFVRDVYWTGDKAFKSIGWDKKLSTHSV